jgi:hypothetical protein
MRTQPVGWTVMVSMSLSTGGDIVFVSNALDKTGTKCSAAVSTLSFCCFVHYPIAHSTMVGPDSLFVYCGQFMSAARA